MFWLGMICDVWCLPGVRLRLMVSHLALPGPQWWMASSGSVPISLVTCPNTTLSWSLTIRTSSVSVIMIIKQSGISCEFNSVLFHFMRLVPLYSVRDKTWNRLYKNLKGFVQLLFHVYTYHTYDLETDKLQDKIYLHIFYKLGWKFSNSYMWLEVVALLAEWRYPKL